MLSRHTGGESSVSVLERDTYHKSPTLLPQATATAVAATTDATRAL